MDACERHENDPVILEILALDFPDLLNHRLLELAKLLEWSVSALEPAPVVPENKRNADELEEAIPAGDPPLGPRIKRVRPLDK
eukprot:9584143-Heterocapsa_arctica.AAC.1